ncbi:MAG: hypothetical protein ACKOZW_10650 [Cyanobium sp.]
MASFPRTPARQPPRWFPSNRRDGSRLLSSALLVSGAGLVRLDHPLGQLVFGLFGLVSLFWWRQYCRLSV